MGRTFTDGAGEKSRELPCDPAHYLETLGDDAGSHCTDQRVMGAPLGHYNQHTKIQADSDLYKYTAVLLND